MRRVAANYIFPIDREPIKNGYIDIDDSGTIISVGTLESESASTEFYNGILCPGFTNAHCHVELSNLQGKFIKGTGMSGFINQINELRESAPKEERVAAIKREMRKMYDEGVTSLGDISNCDESFEIKKNSPIYSRTFVEVFGTEAKDAKGIIKDAVSLAEKGRKMGLDAAVTPHSPYTMSPELLTLAAAEGLKYGFISYHNQESEEEEEMIKNNRGNLYENYIGRGLSIPPATGKPALLHFLNCLQKAHSAPFEEHILLVHNVVSDEESIEAACAILKNVFWITCPLSNLFIHNKLAPLRLFMKHNLKIAVGTDSLSSNDILSMTEEIKCIEKNFPDIPLKTILEWCCRNGAEALEKYDTTGSLTPGKSPGVVFIDAIDFNEMKLTEMSKSKRII